MIEPKIAINEEERLQVLRGLQMLDTESNERFDRLTRLAKRMFDVPVSVVSLVDSDRQWFKSIQGMDVAETPRSVSFCGHAILQNDTFVVEDTLKDERFFDNPMVTNDPNIRFYAGHPLTVANSAKIGTLCLIDSKPRQFGQGEQELLQDLARMAEREIESLQLACVDELTRIYNRRGFMDLARKSLSFCQRLEKSAAMLVFDLDDFKAINDQFGHAEGDRALTAFAGVMSDVFRDSDVIARCGGDEFVAFMGNCDQDGASKFLQRFRECLDHYNSTARRGYNLQYSVGCVAVRPDYPHSVETLMEQADQLMYKSKNSR